MIVLAHGIGGRSDLPIPLWMALYGAVAAVVASFVVLGFLWPAPRLDRSTGRQLREFLQSPFSGAPHKNLGKNLGKSLGKNIGWVARALLALLWLLTLTTAIVGPNNPGANPAPTWFYVWFWVGLVPASLLFGPVWKAVNPLRTISSLISRFIGEVEEDRPDVPARVGYWPSVAGLIAFLWIELVDPAASSPLTVFYFLLIYSTVHITLGVIFGPRWFDKGDAFDVYSTLFGHLSPLARNADGRVVLRNPLSSLTQLKAAPGLMAVLAVVLGSTAFDGLTRTRWYREVLPGLSQASAALLGTAGLLVSIWFIAITYSLATRFAQRYLAPSEGNSIAVPSAFLHSLVPIAAGYTIAHYFSLLIFQGQAGYILASDPLGAGWNLLGTADWNINYTAIGVATIAWVQVAAIVTGHVAGVISAHDRAVGVFPDNQKVKGQYSLLGLMVGYTLGGIALLLGT